MERRFSGKLAGVVGMMKGNGAFGNSIIIMVKGVMRNCWNFSRINEVRFEVV